MGLLDRFRKKKEKTIVNRRSSETNKASFSVEDLEWLAVLAPSEELKERFRNAKNMLKQKILEHWKVDIDSKEFKDLIKLRTLVSSDPKMSEKISLARKIYNQVYGTVVTLDFNNDELKALIDSTKGMCGPYADGLRRKLSTGLQ